MREMFALPPRARRKRITKPGLAVCDLTQKGKFTWMVPKFRPSVAFNFECIGYCNNCHQRKYFLPPSIELLVSTLSA